MSTNQSKSIDWADSQLSQAEFFLKKSEKIGKNWKKFEKIGKNWKKSITPKKLKELYLKM